MYLIHLIFIGHIDFAFLFSCFGIIFGVGLLYVEKVTSHLL